MRFTFALLFLATSIVAAVAAQDLASKGEASAAVAVADTVLAGVSAPPMQERCSVRSDAPSGTCECGPNKTKVANPCIYCSTPSGKRCGEKRCKSCYTVCNPGGSVPPQNPACS